MANSMWKAGDDVVQTVKDLITKHHPMLVDILEEIAVLFKEKGTQVDDVIIAGKTAKAPPLLGALAPEKPYTFIITLAADAWEEMDAKQRLALLDHHLCGCGAKENEKDGEMTYYLRPPDVAFYKEEVERHGAWRSSGGTGPTPNLIEDLFGPQAPAAGVAPVATTPTP